MPRTEGKFFHVKTGFKGNGLFVVVCVTKMKCDYSRLN